jgi:CRP/FNR family transcriptional regulator
MDTESRPRIMLRTAAHGVNCADCALNPVCLPPAVNIADLERLNSIIERNRPLLRGALLFHEGMLFESVFVVRSGALKTLVTLPSGQEQITGFHLPGELVGLDSVGLPSYASTAVALENTAVCTVPFTELEGLSRQLPSLQHHLFKLMSAEIRTDHQFMQLLSQRPAEERVAAFLLSIAARFKRRHLSDVDIHLPMTRGDLGNHLGLTLETTSRIFTRLQHQGLLAVDGKEIRILDRTRLCALADPQQD